jgi:predicted permease
MNALLSTPPRAARWLLERLLSRDEREFILGDLEEEFRTRISESGDARAARRWYWSQAARLITFRPPAAEHAQETGTRKGDGIMQNFLQDLRYGIRMMARTPAFTLIAILTLGLGIGANATIFSWLNAVLLDPLPGVDAPHELLSVHGTSRAQPVISLSYPDFADYRDRNASFAGILAAEESAVSLRAGDAPPERVWAQFVSGNFFDVLGVRALHGRTFLPDEDKTPGTHPVAVISASLWQRRFGSDPNILGAPVTINSRAFTIIGVAPPDFSGSETALRFDVWIPMMMVDTFAPGQNRLQSRGNRWFSGLARLKRGVTLAQAQAEMNGLAQRLAREYPVNDEGIGVTMSPLWKAPRSAQDILGPVLMLMMGVVGVVLLIACANVANLLLARATGRRKEIAVRLAMGAGRARLVRQLLTESTMLALLGGVVGVLIAFWTAGLLMLMVPPTELPVAMDLRVDPRVLAFTFGVALLTGLIFGLAPALQSTRADLVTALKDEASSVAGGRSKGWLRNSLVVAQVSLSLVLLIAAGLFLRSLRAVHTFDLGFNPQNVLLVATDLFPNGYDSTKGRQFYEELLRRVEQLPGVRAVTLARRVPLGFGGTSSTSIRVEGYEPAKDEQVWSYLYNVAPNYLRTMEIPLMGGREFTLDDRRESPAVAVINETLAARYWKDADPIGRRFHFGDEQWVTVVGIARDAKYRTLNEKPSPMIYLPVLQFYRSDLNLHVRTEGDPAGYTAAVQNEIRAMDPNLPVFNIRTMEANIRAASFQQRMASGLLGVFGLLALGLAAVGIYGVISYSVSQRTREMGIRIALGAQRRDILRLILGQGLRLTVVGLVIGLGAAFGVSRFMASLLFGVSTTDVVTFAVLPLLLAGVAMLACWVPARRATRIDPIRALRYE